MFFTISLIIVPLTLEPGTVRGMDGEANRLSNSEHWIELPIYHRIIYTFSDFNCHQIEERSYIINGNQMPVCSRCFGLFSGITIGLLVMSFVKPLNDFKDQLLKLVPGSYSHLPDKTKSMILVGMGSIFALPLILDGGIQLVSNYESTNPIRAITGLLFGFGLAVFFSSMVLSTLLEGENNIYDTHPETENEDLRWLHGKENQKEK